jgi:hypothetical protein
LFVANNLLSGPRMSNESKSKITFTNNLIKDLTDCLVDPFRGNLHLTNEAIDAIDKGIILPDVTEDINREPRDTKVDIGADERIN